MKKEQQNRPSHQFEVSQAALQAALDRVMMDSLPVAVIALAILYTVFTPIHLFVQPGLNGRLMSIIAGSSALFLMILLLIIKKRPISSTWAHPLAAVIALVPTINSAATLYLLTDPQQTTNLMLVIIGLGLFLISARWLVLIYLINYLCWLMIYWQATPSSAWMHFGFALFSATMVSIFIYIVRIKILRRLEGLRILDELRQAEMLRNERMVAMGQMATTLMHEINNPLSVILGYSQILANHQQLPPELTNKVEKIEKMSVRISEIIKQLDSFDDSLVEFGGVKIIDLHRETKRNHEEHEV